MTPAERARLIDQQEFEAESKAALKRALAYSQRKRKEERCRVLGIEVTGGDFNKAPPLPFGRIAKLYTYGGETKTAAEWAKHLGLNVNTFQARLRKNGLAGAINFKAPNRKKGRLITVNGVTRNMRGWAEALGINTNTLQARIARGASPEEAVAMGGRHQAPRKQKAANDNAALEGAGVSADFGPFEETGGWSTAQETPNIDFQGNNA
jgi:hypothetical protein